MKVLIVDDEEIMREMLTEQLAYLGIHKVFNAVSVAEARRILEGESHLFDLIISDYNMPDENGGELLRYLAEKEVGVPFILFTSLINPTLPVFYKNFLGVVAKPDLRGLREMVKLRF